MPIEARSGVTGGCKLPHQCCDQPSAREANTLKHRASSPAPANKKKNPCLFFSAISVSLKNSCHFSLHHLTGIQSAKFLISRTLNCLFANKGNIKSIWDPCKPNGTGLGLQLHCFLGNGRVKINGGIVYAAFVVWVWRCRWWACRPSAHTTVTVGNSEKCRLTP